MRHLDEGTILRIRDGAPVDSVVDGHLGGCVTCRAALDDARTRSESVERILTALDGPVEATAAKAGVRARLRSTGNGPAPIRAQGRHLGRAAALLLVTAAAAAAAALPGSPVRNLWSPTAPTSIVDPAPSPSGTEALSPASSPTPAGITVSIQDGSVHVSVRGAAIGSEISVVWTDESTASVTAPAGSRFTYSSGRVEVDASRGSVGLELPREARLVSLDVDGHLYLTGSANALEVPGPAFERTSGSLRFRVDER
jgi:hypothetical protein